MAKLFFCFFQQIERNQIIEQVAIFYTQKCLDPKILTFASQPVNITRGFYSTYMVARTPQTSTFKWRYL